VLLTGAILWNDREVPGWRVVLILFGVVGILWSLVYLRLVRDRPAEHPWVNPEETRLIDPVPEAIRPAATRSAILVFLGSRTLWAFSMVQFFINIGWAFLVTQFPDYLQLVHNKTGSEKGFMSSLPGFVGCAGMFAGGFLTDWLTRRAGLRRGRLIPILLGAGACGSALVFCATADSAWAVVAALCVVTLGTDLAVPALWAIAQDIGGNRVGPVMGWGNMWGNFGAACCPLLLGWVQREYGWSVMFLTSGAAYGLAMLTVLFIVVDKRLDGH
jgi:MFS transporter, ACS family, glucarate transporter